MIRKRKGGSESITTTQLSLMLINHTLAPDGGVTTADCGQWTLLTSSILFKEPLLPWGH